MVTPHTVKTTLSPRQKLERALRPQAFSEQWPYGYQDRAELIRMFKLFEHRTENQPLVVHIVAGDEPTAYWDDPDYTYWKSKTVPFVETIQSLHEIGLRDSDVVRLNLADHNTWREDISEIRKLFPKQRLSLQIHGHDFELYERDPEQFLAKFFEVASDLQEIQIDISLSANQLFDPIEYIRMLQGIRQYARDHGQNFSMPVVFSGGVGPGTVELVMSPILEIYPHAGTDGVSKLQWKLLGLGGLSSRKSAETQRKLIQLLWKIQWGDALPVGPRDPRYRSDLGLAVVDRVDGNRLNPEDELLRQVGYAAVGAGAFVPPAPY